ncbi:hypothetical protein DL96DRAFT_1766258 [Flagelloscypha sp. PMI_526]|nr:hypothetical protein DL96DRAFT_1766258 [Flagelloscypha sp. PMI_526]
MADADYQQLSIFVLGPWVIGAFADCLLQGLLLGQFTNYFRLYRDDRPFLKAIVAGLVILTCLKTIQSCAIVWVQNILLFNDQPGAINLYSTTWWESGNPLMVAFIGLYVQAYFLYRLRSLSKSWIVVIPITLILVFAFLAMVVATVAIFKARVNEIVSLPLWYTVAQVLSDIAGDLLMTMAMIYHLLLVRKTVIPQTAGLLSALIRLILLSAAPAAVCAMINLLLSQLFDGTKNLMSSAFTQALSKLYAVSMMYMLNSRRSLRAGYDASDVIFGSGSSHQMSRRGQAHTDSDRSLGDIAVHTETRNHIDFHDSFDHTASSGKSGKFRDEGSIV